MRRYTDICNSSRLAGEPKGLQEAEVTLRAGLVLAHEAKLYQSAIAREGSKLACHKTLLLIGKLGLSTDVHPLLYKMCRGISVS